jgi:hypothetical protein
MNWHSHTVALCLWCLQPAIYSLAAVILWRRKLHKQFSAFFYFLVAQDVNFAILFPVLLAGKGAMYFWLFWVGEAVNAVLGFKVIHEVFLDVFRPYHTLKDLGTLLFKWAGVVMLLISVVIAFSSSSNSNDRGALVNAITTLEASVRIVQVGLILFLLLFSRFLGVSRKQISFGISLGFGLFAGVELMLMALNSGGLIKQGPLNRINMVTYLVAALVWVAYSFSPIAVREAGNRLQTQRWEQSLADLQHPAASDSLIPMFEGMVERAFSRSSNLDAPDDDPTHSRSSESFPRSRSAAVGSKSFS